MRKSLVCAVVVNDKGDILAYTCQFSMQACEEFCQGFFYGWNKMKQLGCQIVQAELSVELYELPEPLPKPLVKLEILANKARCKKCNDIIESEYRHDFVTCKCGAISVDGGTDYLRRVGEPSDFEDLSQTKER